MRDSAQVPGSSLLKSVHLLCLSAVKTKDIHYVKMSFSFQGQAEVETGIFYFFFLIKRKSQDDSFIFVEVQCV